MLPDSTYLDRHAENDVRIRGTRVGIEQLLSAYNDGLTADELAFQYRTVTLEQVHGVIAYYLANKAAVDEYLRSWEHESEERRAEWERQPKPDVVLRLRKIAAQRALK
ncbi:MAG: DUF433 domain-containing protein [Pirellulales bacterium]